MATGNKEFFRHSTDAHLNHKIMGMVDKYGKESYYHYFVLVELCARKALQYSITPRKFTLNRGLLRTSFRIKNSRLKFHLNAMKNHELIDFELDDSNAYVSIVSLTKYLGKYEKKIEIKEATPKRTPEQKEKAKKVKVAYITS